MAKTKILNDGITATTIANDKLVNSSITINGSTVSLGGSVSDIGVETFPNISSFTPTVVTNAQTSIAITGTNFTSIPHVEAINSTGAIVPADSITFNSATSLTVLFTLPTDGVYYLRVENPNGLSMRTANADLTVSDNPVWVTASGTVGTFAGDVAIGTITLTCTDATSFTCSPNPPTAGLTFTSGTGSCTLTGTQTAHTSASTDNFTVVATDAEGQTASRAFSISYSFGATGSGGFS
tara:strand:+ start:1656 stop:2369 length:714 start_codon:yes stop_codon:yes gene_type:complete